MMGRRLFANCAICSAIGLIATGVDAQTAPPGFQRVVMHQIDGPAEGYTTLLIRVEIAPKGLITRHTHPGIETGYAVAGGGTLSVQGQPDLVLKPGDGYQVPTGAVHSLQNGDVASTLVATFVVEKGKPLATPAP